MKKEKTGKKRHIGLKIFLSIVVVISALYGAGAITNQSTTSKLIKYAKSFDKVNYENQKKPELNDNNQYYFKTDEEFKIMQLTDVHLGSGMISYKKDKMALNAVAAMISYEKPDLVVVTGDIAFPVPYIAGTINNKNPAKVFTSLLDTLGVYYTVAFGNHDTEMYSYYNRKQIASFYYGKKYCLFTNNYNKQIYGQGNQIINIYNENNLIRKSLYIMDSNAYLSSDPFGIKWEYDNVHENQIEWYRTNVTNYNSYNNKILNSLSESEKPTKIENFTTAQSFIFQHIPLEEYKEAYLENLNNNYEDTANSHFNFGAMGEDSNGKMIYSPKHEDNFFETMVELNSTKAMFCGHDHLNNFSIKYKGIDLTYGMSIDYLAYSNINKYGSQRGCTIINVENNGDYTIKDENYYQEKYVPKYDKEEVTMEDYYKA